MLAVRAQPQDSERAVCQDQPLLDLDLRAFGYDTSSATRRLREFVDFTDLSNLALAWLALDDPREAKKIGPLTPRPAHLHILLLDARTGSKQGLQEWPTPSTPVRFSGLGNGKFLTCTGNVLRLFSPGFEVIREQNLQSERTCLSFLSSGTWGVSPSRRSLLLYSRSEKGYENTLVNSDTFATNASWIDKFPTNGISDHWLTAFCGQRREICIRGVDQSWQPFQPGDLGEQTNHKRVNSAVFVNDGTLAIELGNRMLVAKADGTLLFQVRLPERRSFGTVATSSGGERFAVIENRSRGLRSELLDMYPFASNDRVVVYSISDRRDIYAVRVRGTSPWTPWDFHTNQLALSPDGVLLAVISDGRLKVYRLPCNKPG